VTPLVHELAVDGYPVAVTCRVLKVATSTYYDWLKPRPPSSRDLADAYLLNAIIDIHRTARGTYGVRRVHAELTLGQGERCCRQRVERLMRLHGLQGVHRR
jgi:putative transposase